MSISLTDILGDVSVADFSKNYWGQRPLLTIAKNESHLTKNLFSFDALEQLLANETIPPSHLSIVGRDNNHKSLNDIVRADGGLNVVRILSHYKNGSTIVINRLRNKWLPIANSCLALERDFGHPVDANSYVTPKLSQGFPIHADPHEVLIVQVEGVKRWKVYERILENPLPEMMSDIYNNSAPIMEFDLSAGDTLYLPSGFPHEALTSSKHASLHLTFGIHRYRWSDLLKKLIDIESTQNPSLREPLPFGSLNDATALSEELAGRIGGFRLLESTNLNAAVAGLAREFRSRTREAGSHSGAFSAFETINNKSKITSNTKFNSPYFRQTSVTTDKSSRNFLNFPGGTLSISEHQLKICRELTNKSSFSMQELENFDQSDECFTLIEALIDAGVILCVKEQG